MLRLSLATAALLSGVAAKSTVSPCEALKAAGLSNRLITPTDSTYSTEVNSWWASNGRQLASCFILPQTTAEVALTLTTLIASGNGTSTSNFFAIRSGGHSSTGSSSITNGVTIDLSRLNATTYDKATNIASIGPGGKWEYVYEELVQRYGVTVVGGRDGDVGVGGFLLGGGNSYYSGRGGFGCDSVANFEVVLADGRIVNANATGVHADLWRALKGGGNGNFGIVTRFDLEAMPAPDLFRDQRVLSGEEAEAALVDAVVGFAASDESLADDAFFTFFSYSADVRPDIFAVGVHVNIRGVTDNPTPFDGVKALPAFSNVTVVQNIAEAAFASQVEGGAWGFGLTLTFNNDRAIAQRCVDLHAEFVESLKGHMAPDAFYTQMFLQPLPAYRWEIGARRGGNVLGLDHLRNDALLWTAGVGLLTDDAPRDVADSLLKEMGAKIVEFAKSVGGDMDFVYINYAGAEQDPLGTYGAANVQFMKDVAAKYDPTGVFQTRVPGGFKLSNVK